MIEEQKLEVGGVFKFEHVRNGKVIDVWEEHNLVTNEGLNQLLNVYFRGAASDSTWAVGIFDTAYVPQADDAGSNISTRSSESQAYVEATRPTWTPAAAASQEVTNSANKATFTMNAPTTIYGAFLINDNAKGGTTGQCFAVTQFTQSRAVVETDQLLVTYTIQAASGA